MTRFSRLRGSADARAAAGLGLRYVAARLSAIVTIALAALAFPIEAFATFGTYAALLNLLWLAVFLRYEPAVISARSSAEAASFIRLCCAVGGATVGASACGALALAIAGVVPSNLAALFCAALAARALLKLATALATRAGDTAAIGDAAIAQAIGQTALLVALAFLAVEGALALVLADLAGHAIAAAFLASRGRQALAAALRSRWRIGELARRAQEARSLPLLNLPGALLALAFAQAPLLALPWLADRALAGALALALRIFDMPTQLIAAVLTPVLQHRLARSEGSAGRLRADHVAALAVGVAATFAALVAAIAAAGPWLAGTGLAGLVAVAPAAGAFQAGLAVAIPLLDACSLYRDQRALVGLHLAASAAAAGCAALAVLGSAESALAALAGVSALRAALVGQRLLALSRAAAAEA